MSLGDGSLDFVPLLPWPWLAALALAAVLVLGYGLWRRARGQAWRALAVAIVLIALANPSYVVETRTYLPNVAVVVVDESPSQRIGKRRARTATALAAIRKQVAAMPNLTLRVVRRSLNTLAPCIELCAQGVLKPGDLVTHAFAAREIARAFETVDRGEPGLLKAVVDLTQW